MGVSMSSAAAREHFLAREDPRQAGKMPHPLTPCSTLETRLTSTCVRPSRWALGQPCTLHSPWRCVLDVIVV